MPDERRFLFIIGCPRSGTSALWAVVNSHPLIALGLERYGRRMRDPEQMDPRLFERDRFFRPEPGDTFYSDLEAFHSAYRDLRARYDDALYVGDKIPLLYERLPALLTAFPKARVLFIVRNVVDTANSYIGWFERRQRNDVDPVVQAVAHWSRAIEMAYRYHADPRVLVVHYERLFVAAEGIERVFDFLELDMAPEVHDGYQRAMAKSGRLQKTRRTRLSDADLARIGARAPVERYETLVADRPLGSGRLVS